MTTFYHERMPNTSGIYRITCTVTEKIYIGSAVNLRWRRKCHFGYLQRNEHRNPKLQAAWNKYGSDAFTFEVLELVLLSELLTAREQYYLDTLKPFGHKGFNLAPTAGSTLGVKYSPEARERLSEIQRGNTYNRGKKLSPEQRERLGLIRRGKKQSEEWVRKAAATRIGTKRSAATREKMRLSALGHAPTNAKTALVISPDGQKYTVHNLAEFCREHGLKASGLSLAASGKRKQYKGWKAQYT